MQQVHVLNHHAGVLGDSVLGVYITPLAAQVAALNHARTRLAQGRAGADTLTWTAVAAGWHADSGGGRAAYSVTPQPVITEIPAVVDVAAARIGHLADLVRQGLIDLDVIADTDLPAVRAALADA
jgi:hypothetical protein